MADRTRTPPAQILATIEQVKRMKGLLDDVVASVETLSSRLDQIEARLDAESSR